MRNLAKLYFASSALFWAAIISVHGFLVVTATEQFGLSSDRAVVPMILVHFAIVAMEIPTGILADTWRRTFAAVAGQLLVSAILMLVPLFPQHNTSERAALTPYWLGFAISFAIGWALFSGATKGFVSQLIRENEPNLMHWFVRMNSGWNNASILFVTFA